MTAKIMPRPSQEAAIDAMVNEPSRGVLLASEMGTGKTLVVCEFIVRLALERVLIVGVKDTFDQWRDRLLAQGGPELRRIDSTKAGKAAFEDMLAGLPGAFFSGSQMLTARDWDHKPKLDQAGMPVHHPKTGKPLTERVHLKTFAKMKPMSAIIFDEVHVIANRKAVGRRTIKSIKTEWRVGASGTWYRNSFAGAWSVTNWIWPTLVDASYIRWQEAWCSTETVYLPGGESTLTVTGERSPGLYVSTLPLYIREEATELPPAPEIFYVDVTVQQRAQMNDIERDMVLYLDAHDGGRDMTIADLPIVLRSRCRTITLGEVSLDAGGNVNFAPDAESAKLWALRQILDDADHRGRQVAIYTHSKKFAKLTVARMQAAGYNAVEWSGDISSAERARIKEAFISGQVTYLVAVIAAFNAGLDGFQAVCNRVVWLSEAEDQADNDQALARFFRPGRVGDFMHTKIVARDTHDEGIYSSLALRGLINRETMSLAA